MSRSLPLLAALSCTLSLAAQITLTDANVTYSMTDVPAASDALPTNDLTARAAAGDQLYQLWWLYRVRNDGREYAFNKANNQVTVRKEDSIATYDWANVDRRGFAAKLFVNVMPTHDEEGYVHHTMRITNSGRDDLTISVFCYVDVDVCGATNSAVKDDSEFNQKITNANCARDLGRVMTVAGGDARWQVGAFAQIRTLLLDANADDLTNAGLPFGPGDYTAAFQWKDVVIRPGAEKDFGVQVMHNGSKPEGDGPAKKLGYGLPKAGSNGLPELDSNYPMVGGRIRVQVRSGLPGSSPYLILGVTQTQMQLSPIGTIYVVPMVGVFLPPCDATGRSHVHLATPNDVGLSGLHVYQQAILVDPGAIGGIAHTAGLEWVFGRWSS